MKTLKALSLFAFFFTLLASFSFAADLSSKVDRPVIKVGDTWVYTKTIGTNVRTYTLKAVEVQPDGGYQLEVQSSASSGPWAEKYDKNGNVISDLASTYSPSREIFRFPLEVGKVYPGSQFSRTNIKDASAKYTMNPTIKSITQEKVEVKAGTFNAIKIEVEIAYDGRGTKGHNVSNVVVETYWYSPEVGRWVKRNYNDHGNKGLETWELVSFKRG